MTDRHFLLTQSDSIAMESLQRTLEEAVKCFKSSQLSNEIRINIARLKLIQILSFTICQQVNENTKYKNTYNICEHGSAELRLPYPPLLLSNKSINISISHQNGTCFNFDVRCKQWQINIENCEPGRLTGWIAVESPAFVLRPFILSVNNNEVSYTTKIGGERVDTTAALKQHNLKGYEIIIFYAIPCFDVASVDILMYYSLHKTSFMEKIFPVDRWQLMEKSNFSSQLRLPKQTINHANSQAVKIAVLMPIYNGVKETIEAINSFKNYLSCNKYSNLEVRFILGLDNPDNHEMKERILSLYGCYRQITIICNQVNLGFIGNCNNMFKFVREDEEILLVNSDIIAPQASWIEKMLEYAMKDSMIGTVTPLSNQATIFSYPIPNEKAQFLLPHIDIDETNALLSDVSISELIDVPSCHGFCVLIMNTRLSLESLFDPIFGKGYGEENDFSRRIASEGYRNICCPHVYIYHCESVSFGPAKLNLVLKNLEIVNRRHKHYALIIEKYCSNDPLRKYRNKCSIKYLEYIKKKNNKELILHVCHARGGGTHKFIVDYSRKNDHAIHCLLTPLEDSGLMSLQLIQPDRSEGTYIDTVKLAFLSEKEVIQFASVHIVSRAILHSLIDFLDNSTYEWVKMLISHSFSQLYFHDYHWISVFENLLDPKLKFIGSFQPCDSLVDLYLAASQNKPLVINKGSNLHRRTMKGIIDQASEVIFPSKASRDIALSSYKFKNQCRVIPHDNSTNNGEKISMMASAGQAGVSKRIAIAIIGAIGPNKGAYTLFDICRYIDEHDLPLDIYVIGFTCNDNEIKGYPFVHIVGKYDEKDFHKIVKDLNIKSSLFLSPWPETFSYTLSLAFEHKLWPFVLNIGAPAERVIESGFGTILTSEKADKICRQILDEAHL